MGVAKLDQVRIYEQEMLMTKIMNMDEDMDKNMDKDKG